MLLRLHLLFLAVLVFLTACGTVATPRYQADALLNNARASATAIIAQAYTEAVVSPSPSPTFTSTASHTKTATATSSPSNTPLPTVTFTSIPTETIITSWDIPVDAAERVLMADAVRGQEFFNSFQAATSFACVTCHRTDSEDRLIGPGLLNVGIRAESRVLGLNAGQYLYQSIVNPSAYVVEGFPDHLMPQNWAEVYSDAEIYDIIAYLLSLEN